MEFTPLLKFAQDYGIWTALFIGLFIYVLRESKAREERLMTFLDNIVTQFERLSKQFDRIARDVEEIKSGLKRK